jgi:hypothetical protein
LLFKGDEWKIAHISIETNEDFYIEFNAITGIDQNALIALDDIKLSYIEHCQSIFIFFTIQIITKSNK